MVALLNLIECRKVSEDRFSRYFCNKCGIERAGPPLISYENPNEELVEGVILIEKGEYKRKVCDNILALYRNSFLVL
jgi:hypothetical protein